MMFLTLLAMVGVICIGVPIWQLSPCGRRWLQNHD